MYIFELFPAIAFFILGGVLGNSGLKKDVWYSQGLVYAGCICLGLGLYILLQGLVK